MKYLTEEVLSQVYDYIVSYQLENGVAPSYRNICQNCKIPSTDTVSRILDKLYERGSLSSSQDKGIATPSSLVHGKSRSVSVIGSVACGTPITAIENIESTVALPDSIFGSFDKYILKAKGNSMVEKGINDGDLMVIKKTESAEIGDIVIARVNEDEVTAKIFSKDANGTFYLKPANSSLDDTGEKLYKDIYPQGNWAIAGIVEYVIHHV